MSFAVFGASMDMCLKTARKRVKKVKGIGKHAVTLTQSEWELEVKEYAKELFHKYEQGKRKPVKISADLTTPNACREFIELAKKNSGLHHLAHLPASA
jgi:hypothetical protein